MASGEMTNEAFRVFLMQTFGAAAKVSRDGAVHFICMDWRHMDDVSAVGRSIYGDLLNLCVWNKSNAGMGSLYRSKHELVFVYRVGTARPQSEPSTRSGRPSAASSTPSRQPNARTTSEPQATSRNKGKPL